MQIKALSRLSDKELKVGGFFFGIFLFASQLQEDLALIRQAVREQQREEAQSSNNHNGRNTSACQDLVTIVDEERYVRDPLTKWYRCSRAACLVAGGFTTVRVQEMEKHVANCYGT
jgi:hypothetical protein